MGGVGRKSIEDRVHKSSGGGRETKKMKMAGGIKSSMERRVKNWLGGWAREELLVASKRAVSACLACLETGWVRDMARGPNRVSVVIPCNFLQNINHGLSPSCSWARPATLFCRSATVFVLGRVLISRWQISSEDKSITLMDKLV